MMSSKWERDEASRVQEPAGQETLIDNLQNIVPGPTEPYVASREPSGIRIRVAGTEPGSTLPREINAGDHRRRTWLWENNRGKSRGRPPQEFGNVAISQTVEGVHADRDVVVKLQTVEHGTFITVMDWSRTLYGVQAAQARSQPTPAQARQRPAILLGGDLGITSFVGRDTELARLTQWYDSPDRLSVMLLHGVGGQGKTRLMRRFAEIIRKRQEQPRIREAVSLVEASVEGLAGKGVTADIGNSALPDLLLLVDEADTWPTAKLLTLFRDAITWHQQHVRVLLTARASNSWWAGLQAELGNLEIASDDLRLGPLDAAGIRELADAANRSLAQAQNRPQPPLPHEALEKLAKSPPLSIELMVLARQHASKERMPTGLRSAVKVILEKEQRYWARLYGMDDSDPNRVHLNPALMARAVYVSTLTGPLPSDLALEVIQHAQISATADPQQAIDDHARCYPPSALPANRLAPLAACLAEEFLGILVPDGRAETDVIFDDSSDPWADSAPFRVLGLLSPQQRDTCENAQRRAAAAGIETSLTEPEYPSAYTFGPQLDPTILRLVRAASTRPHLAEQQLYPLARHYPKAVVMADNTALAELLAIQPAPPADVLNALEKAISTCDRGNLEDYRAALASLTPSADSVVPHQATDNLQLVRQDESTLKARLKCVDQRQA